jgi:hypothetical protein
VLVKSLEQLNAYSFSAFELILWFAREEPIKCGRDEVTSSQVDISTVGTTFFVFFVDAFVYGPYVCQAFNVLEGK